VFLPYTASAQGFGCFDVSSKSNLDGAYVKEHVPSYSFLNINWNDYSTAIHQDGYYKEYFPVYECYPQQLKMEGFFLNGVRTGQWMLYLKNSSCFFTGNFKDGKKEGIWAGFCVKNNNDTIYRLKESFIGDILDGKCTEYFDNGRISITTEYSNGLKNGWEISYFDNDTSHADNIETKSHYVSGLLEGERIEYNFSNDTLVYENYIRGKHNGKCSYRNNFST
jgi:antitoxin component YwqK of YwqJK toxin-antitoxin module